MTTAVIFDCDGLLVDTERVFEAAYRAALEARDRTLRPRVRRRLLGANLIDAAKILCREHGLREDATRLADDLEQRIFALLPSMARPLPGADRLLARLGSWPKAIASNSPRRIVEATLIASGLAPHLDLLACPDDGLEPKPAPDLYLDACRQLGVAPSEATAFEDSPRGVEAARRAGLWVIGIASIPDLHLDADLNATALDDDAVLAALGLEAGNPVQR